MSDGTPSVAFVGLGYVGLSTALCFSRKGFDVTGIDLDARKVNQLESGRPGFEEPDVEGYLKSEVAAGRIRFTRSYEGVLDRSTAIFITVGTPGLKNGATDLRYVKSAAASIGAELKKVRDYRLVVVKSSVPPGATEDVVGPQLERRSGKIIGDFGLAVNPEFLREGSAIKDTLAPDRVVIGSADDRSGEELDRIYRRFYGDGLPRVLRTNIVNAEAIKYASNAFLATKISFINEIAELCGALPGADVATVAEGMGLDARIGNQFLKAGLGYGGSCFPKDIPALLDAARRHGVRMSVARAGFERNKKQPLVALKLARNLLGSLKGKRVALLGLSFKPLTDDMREAVSIVVIRELLKSGAEVIGYDPAATANATRIFGSSIRYAKSSLECITGADCCILVTEWEEFSRLQPEAFLSRMRQPILIDGRRVFDPAKFRSRVSFAAVGLGRRVVEEQRKARRLRR